MLNHLYRVLIGRIMVRFLLNLRLNGYSRLLLLNHTMRHLFIIFQLSLVAKNCGMILLWFIYLLLVFGIKEIMFSHFFTMRIDHLFNTLKLYFIHNLLCSFQVFSFDSFLSDFWINSWSDILNTLRITRDLPLNLVFSKLINVLRNYMTPVER